MEVIFLFFINVPTTTETPQLFQILNYTHETELKPVSLFHSWETETRPVRK
jgi:hypothetical protein